MKRKIYLIGNALSSDRGVALVEYLIASPVYSFYYSDPSYSIPNNLNITTKNDNFLRRAAVRLVSMLDRLYSLPKLFMADTVFVLPMANLFFFERVIIRIMKKKVIGEFYISMYDTIVNDRKLILPGTLRANRWLKYDQNLFDISSIVVFVTKSDKDYYLKIVDRENTSKAVEIVPLCTSQKQKARLPYANGLHEELTLCWWGTYIPLHGLEKIIKAAEFLKNSNLNFQLYIFGTSDDLSEPYQRFIKECGLGNFIIVDNSKRFADHSLDEFLALHCDIAFGNFGISQKAKTVMVNKVVEASSMQIPVVSQRTLSLAEYFEDNQNIFFSELTSDAVAKKIIQISSDKDLMIKVANNAFQLYKTHFSREAYIQRISGLL